MINAEEFIISKLESGLSNTITGPGTTVIEAHF